jgi:outer membrane protein assembly factor BamB
VSNATGEETRSAVAIASVVNSPPAVGADAIWLATPDGKLHELRFDASVVTLPANCNTTQQLVGPPAVAGQHAFVGSKAEVMITADASGFCTPANAPAAVSSPPSLTAEGKVIVATGSILRRMTLPESGVLKDDWTGVSPAPAAPGLPDIVGAPIGVDVNGGMWTVAQNGAVNRTTDSATTSVIVSLSGGSAGAIVLADNSVVLSDAAKRLVRARPSGSPPWTSSDSLTGVPAIGLLLNGSNPTILVPTDQGRIYAINQIDGHVQWSAELSGQPLQPANIWTEPGATTSTAFLAGADGNLYAVIVDGALDTSAPWPKAFHDPQNTSNAGVTP